MEIILEFHSLMGAMRDDLLCFITKIWINLNSENHPPAHSVRFPPSKGDFLFSDPEARGIETMII